MGPGGPLELDSAAGADGASDAAWGSVYVTIDVLCSEVVGLHEAEVSGFLVPGVVSASLEAWQDRWKVSVILPSSDRREGASILYEVVVIH